MPSGSHIKKWSLGFVILPWFLITFAAHGQSLGISAPTQTGAQSSEPALTLKALVDELKKNNAQLRSAQRFATAAQYGVEPARAPDNPTFNITQNPVSYNPFAIGTSQGMTWSLSQNLSWPGKKRLSGEIAQAQADLTKAQVDSLQVQLIGQLKTAWSTWQQIQQQIRILRSQLERLDQIKQATQLRYAQNAAAYADNINAQINQSQVRTDLLGLDGQARTLIAQINALIGRSPASPLSLSMQEMTPEREVPSIDTFRQLALDRNPLLRASQHSIRGAQRSVELAELGSRPDFNVAVLFNSATPPWGFDSSASYGVNLGVTFPLWFNRKEKNLIDQSKALLTSTEDVDESLRQQTILGIDNAYIQWTQSLEQLRLLEERVLEQARIAYRLSLANYGTGQVGFVDLMNAYNGMKNAEINTMQARAAAIQARVALDVAIGDFETTKNLDSK